MKFNLLLLILLLLFSSCTKEIDISEFSDDFAGYQSELRIEALILPSDNTAIVRIDRSVLINETELFNCIDDNYGIISKDVCNAIENSTWHGTDGVDETAPCGNWNLETDDVGSDGIDSNQPSGQQPDSDGTESNGVPDCGEPNVDEYEEYLPDIHVTDCTVIIIHDNQSCNLEYDIAGGNFFYSSGKGKGFFLFENMSVVNYGAYRPDVSCDGFNWKDFDGEYSFEANCDGIFEQYGKIKSKTPIRLSHPVIFYDYENHENMKNCSGYTCIESNTISDDTLYFSNNSPNEYIYYASLLESSYYQVSQFLLDKNSSTENDFIFFHGHPNQATDVEGIYENVCLINEKIVAEIFDGNDDEIDEADISKYEIFTFNKSFTNYYAYDLLDIRDPIRTNLRDNNGVGDPVMGTFGAISSNSIFLRVIDCSQFDTEETCDTNSQPVCEWNGECGTINFAPPQP